MMTNSQLATASLDDIVFDGRNRRYGAYQLRALYQRHVVRALGIATAIFALLMVFPLLAQWLKEEVIVARPTVVESNPIIVEQPMQPEIITPPAAAKPPVQPPQPSTVRDLVPVVAADDKAPDEPEVPNQADLIDKTPGRVTQAGDPGADLNPNLDDLRHGPGTAPEATGETVSEKPYIYVEQMPQLPGGGGTAAIVAAIQRAVRYPGEALRNGVEGKVFVSFTVNFKGDVVDVQIVKGLGFGLDEETMRAIKTLPKFIPGKQNGREVSVSFTVPVTYKIQ